MPEPTSDEIDAHDETAPSDEAAPAADAPSTETTETSETTGGETGDGEALPAAVDLPQRFHGSFRLGRFDGGATLVVDQGELTVHPDSSLQAQGGFQPLTHDQTTVRVYAARWQPPTSNTGVLVEDGDQMALVDLPAWSRKRLRTALSAAGFERDETVTSLRLGRDLVRPTKRWWD